MLISHELNNAFNEQIGHEFAAGLQYVSIAAHFNQKLRRKHVRQRKRNQLDSRRGNSIEARHRAARAQRQGEALVAVAEEVASREQIVPVAAREVMIDFADQAVHAIAEGIIHLNRSVRRIGWVSRG